MRIFWTAVLSLFFIAPLCAQVDFNHYTPLRSQGEIPSKFTTSSTQKYLKQVQQNVSKDDTKGMRKTKEKFYLESSFIIDELLLSGRVLYNDPISDFASKVLDTLLKNEGDLRGKIEVYAVKSDAVNAFTTGNGIIFITTGLIAQLEDESQLAFILCHEVIHYVKDHVINGYIEKERLRSGEGVYRTSSLDEKLLAKASYDKTQEKEADAEGLNIYMKSPYGTGSIPQVFDVLRFADLPFDIIPYERRFLEDTFYRFPDEYYLAETEKIEADDEEDPYATHPSAMVRKDIIEGMLKEKGERKGVKYIIGKSQFEYIRKLARYEIVYLLLNNRKYEEAFYHVYLLMQDEPDNPFLRKSLGQALYGLAIYSSASEFWDVHLDYELIEGPSQQVYHMFEKMPAEEITALAIRYLWPLKKGNPDDHDISMWLNDLFDDLISVHRLKPEDFAKEAPAPADTSVAIQPTDSTERLSKYDKLRQEEEVEVEESRRALAYAFLPIYQTDSAAFSSYFQSELEEAEKRKEKEEYEKTAEYRQKLRQERKENSRKGYALGIDKVVFVNPNYSKINEMRGDEALRLVASEEAQKAFNDQLREMARLAGLKYEMLDKKDLRASGTDAFNELAVLNEYISEYLEHDDVEFSLPVSEELKALQGKYGTPYFAWTGVISVQQSSFQTGDAFQYCNYYSCLLVPFYPYFIYNIFRPHYQTYFYSMVLNVETGESVFSTFEEVRMRDRKDVLNSILFDLFHQFKAKRTESK